MVALNFDATLARPAPDAPDDLPKPAMPGAGLPKTPAGIPAPVTEVDERAPVSAPWEGDAAPNVVDMQLWKSHLVYKPGGDALEPKRFINFRLHLASHPAMKGGLRLNQFSGAVEVGRVPWNLAGDGFRKLSDLDAVRAREWLQGLGLQPSKEEARDALESAAADNCYHPIREFLTGLVWDGAPRLDRWLVDHMQVADTPYARAIASKVLISAVARVMRPGCQVDTMLVLEGPQGFCKSSAVSALFGAENTLEAFALFGDQKRMVMSLMGKWAVEIAEFAAIKSGDMLKVKGLVSARVDTVALNYARVASDHPRQSIFIASINPGETGYLSDSTGNRRYWPVEVQRKIDIAALSAAREQLWAEAYRRFIGGERWWLTAEEEELAAPQQAAREETHPWDEILRGKLEGFTEIRVVEALNMLGLQPHQLTRGSEREVGGCLRRLGFKRATSGKFRFWKR